MRGGTRIKVCGITRVTDGVAAAEAGVDAIGLMFYPGSKRAISVERAAALARELPPFLLRVGVFVNPTRDEVRRAIDIAGIQVAQFHGEEEPGDLLGLSIPVLKAFRVASSETLLDLPRFRQTAGWLLDSYHPNQRGGSGETFNWDIAVRARELGHPMILAGGLRPENVAEAVRTVRPYGVDVASGVESAPGIKDPVAMGAFVAAVREGDKL